MPAIVGLIVILAVLLILLPILLFRLMWRVAEPNEALVISGLHERKPDGVGESLGFKIITGKGTMVMPGIQVVRRLSLDLRETELQIDCVTQQGIPLKVRGVVIYKVGDDYASIANAARRFLDQQNQMDQRVHNLFAGHLRAIVGNMTVEEMIRDREKLTSLTREHAGTEMEKLGLIVDSMQIQEIVDPTGYIENLARPHAVAVLREARIAQAAADQAATEKEQQAEALKALARRDAAIKQAGYQAEIDQAAAQAKQAGPLSEATARQKVVVEETKVAQLEAQRAEQQLQVEVRKPADAKAYERTTLAKAERDSQIMAAEAASQRVKLEAAATSDQTRMIGDAEASATRARGLAEGEAIKAKGLAEAEAIKARGEALAEHQEAVIGQELAEQWPAIVEAAAKPFGSIDQLIVLNGAEGISETLAQAVSQGAAGLKLARSLLARPGEAKPSGNGTGRRKASAKPAVEETVSGS